MTLTIYTEDYDEKDEISDGFCGDVLLDGAEKRFYAGTMSENLSEALKCSLDERINIDEIVFCYRDGNEQKFMRFNIK